MTTQRTKQTAEEAYVAAHMNATALLDEISDHLGDMPVPDEDVRIHWGHVGNLGRVNELLKEINDFLAGRNY